MLRVIAAERGVGVGGRATIAPVGAQRLEDQRAAEELHAFLGGQSRAVEQRLDGVGQLLRVATEVEAQQVASRGCAGVP